MTRVHVRRPAPPPASLRRALDPASAPSSSAPTSAPPIYRWRAIPTSRGSGSPLPQSIKARLEAYSGQTMDEVRVHADSDQPGPYGARAFAQGRDIHLAPGERALLAHEAWHVAQQKAGRVPVTGRVADRALNADTGLEAEAERMAPLLERGGDQMEAAAVPSPGPLHFGAPPMQRVIVSWQPDDAVVARAAKNLASSVAGPVLSVKAFQSYKLGVTENLHLVGHGGGIARDQHGGSVGSATTFAGLPAATLAKKIAARLPDDYSGRVFLVQCSAAGQNPDGAPTFAQDFTDLVHKNMQASGILGFGKRRLGPDFEVHAPAGNAVVGADSGRPGRLPQGQIGYRSQDVQTSFLLKKVDEAQDVVIALSESIVEQHNKAQNLSSELTDRLALQNNQLVPLMAELRDTEESALRWGLTVHRPLQAPASSSVEPSRLDVLTEYKAALSGLEAAIDKADEIDATAAQFRAGAALPGLMDSLKQAARDVLSKLD